MSEAEAPLNALDRAIAWIAPQWGLKRQWARFRSQAVQAAARYYDGASTGRRGASIRRRLEDVNATTASDLPNLRQGSRDLVRNNAHVKRAVEAIVANTVGTGLTPQFERDGVEATDIEALARQHLQTTDCDSDRRLTLGGIESLAMWSMVESGEVLIRRRRRRPQDGFAVPVQFQVLEADHLDETRDGPATGGGQIIQGVEFDAIGRRRAYWLYPEHPGANRRPSGQSRPVPADDIIHLYRPERPGQVRGIPWVAPVLLRVADWNDLMDAHVMRQKIAACFAGFIKSPMDSPRGQTKTDDDDTISQLEPGVMDRLAPGEEVEFASPPGVDRGDEFGQMVLREIAAGWGVSYEAMTSDLRNVNFSSGKMGRLEFQRNIDRWAKLLLIPQMAEPLTRWFLEAAELAGHDTDGVTVRHIPPKREMIDPTREIPAERTEIRAGLKTWDDAALERGHDPEDFYRRYQEGLARFDRMEITVDSDARQRTNAGLSIDDDEEGGVGEDEAEALMEALMDRIHENGSTPA